MAVKRLQKWGSLDRAPADVRDRLPPNFGDIRAFFLDPPTVPAPDLRFQPTRGADVIAFLCGERGFSETRVCTVLDRLREAGRRKRTLEDFAEEARTDKP
jgi:hypothetical protein